MQEVPRIDVGEAIGLGPDEEGEDISDMDEIDLRLSRKHHYNILIIKSAN